MADLTDTICALSSAPGRSGIALIRVSGPDCRKILKHVFEAAGPRAEMPDRRMVLGRIRDPRTQIELDEALAVCFYAPRSYTGEDVAEISVHGSPVVVKHLLDFLCHGGARLAEPGEFTLRAFLNGRLDLAQAEAVRDIVESHTLYQLQVAARQKSGELSRLLGTLKRQLVDIIVALESAVEFVEEDLDGEPRAAVAGKLQALTGELKRWAGSFGAGRIVRDGMSLAVVGRPNVGKSSLFNALLAEERSIVTEMPGTTRDLVSESVEIEGVPVRLLDTAGLREDPDRIERLGVERSLRAIADVDAILLVADTSRRREEEDEKVRRRLCGLSCIVALNKSDLPSAWTETDKAGYAETGPRIEVSALTGQGVDALRQGIRDHLLGQGGMGREGLLVTNLRHWHCLQEARQRLEEGAAALSAGASEEFVLADLHRGLKKLGEITGETGVEEILGEIFSRFCVGK
jgi:tRNA modification GTPase